MEWLELVCFPGIIFHIIEKSSLFSRIFSSRVGLTFNYNPLFIAFHLKGFERYKMVQISNGFMEIFKIEATNIRS